MCTERVTDSCLQGWEGCSRSSRRSCCTLCWRRWRCGHQGGCPGGRPCGSPTLRQLSCGFGRPMWLIHSLPWTRLAVLQALLPNRLPCPASRCAIASLLVRSQYLLTLCQSSCQGPHGCKEPRKCDHFTPINEACDPQIAGNRDASLLRSRALHELVLTVSYDCHAISLLVG